MYLVILIVLIDVIFLANSCLPRGLLVDAIRWLIVGIAGLEQCPQSEIVDWQFTERSRLD